MSNSPPAGLMPPTYLMAALVLMFMANHYAPLWPLAVPPWSYLGGVLVLAGFGLVVWCAVLHSRYKTTLKPSETPTSLITSGPHRFSRNPIYVGMVVILIGFAVLLGGTTPWLVVPFFIATMRGQFILDEEAALAERFGGEYEDYRRRVRRWI